MRCSRDGRKKRLKKAAFARKIRVFLGRLLFLATAGILLFWGGRQIYDFCLVHAIQTKPARMGNLSITYSAQGIILRSETVVKSPGPGRLIPLVLEGKRIRAGTVVARLESLPGLVNSQEVKELRAPQAGLVCYHIDGWEGILAPDNWKRLDPLFLFNNFTAAQSEAVPETVQAGDPAFKIIDNLVNPCLILKVDKDQLSTFESGDKVELKWGEAKKGKGRVLAWTRKSDALLVTVELLETNAVLPCSRTFQFQVTSQKYKGIIVPARSLTTRNEKEIGVFIASPVGFKFQKVEIVGRLGDQVAVQGINPGTEVVLNPTLAKRVKKEI